jgi:hypothetical protein
MHLAVRTKGRPSRFSKRRPRNALNGIKPIPKRPDFSLSPSFWRKIWKQHCVYGWRRGRTYLYVAYTESVMRRLSYHNIIDQVERVRTGDSVDLWFFATAGQARTFEMRLIKKFRPYYSYNAGRKEAMAFKTVKCLRSGKRFTKNRWWQKFCGECDECKAAAGGAK